MEFFLWVVCVRKRIKSIGILVGCGVLLIQTSALAYNRGSNSRKLPFKAQGVKAFLNPSPFFSEDNAKVIFLPPDLFEGYSRIGFGFDTKTLEYKGNCVDFRRTRISSARRNTTYQVQRVESAIELRKKLGLLPGALFSLGVYQKDARLSLLKKIKDFKTSSYMLVTSRVPRESRMLSGFELNDQARHLLKRGKLSEFSRVCGDQLVIEEGIGAEFYALVEFHLARKTEGCRIDRGIQLAVERNRIGEDLLEWSEHVPTEVTVAENGKSFSMPLKDLADYASHFSSRHRGDGDYWTLGYRSISYSAFVTLPKKVWYCPWNRAFKQPLDHEEQRTYLENLEEKFQIALELKAKSDRITDNHEDYSEVDREKLRAQQYKMAELIQHIQEHAERFSQDSISPRDIEDLSMFACEPQFPKKDHDWKERQFMKACFRTLFGRVPSHQELDESMSILSREGRRSAIQALLLTPEGRALYPKFINKYYISGDLLKNNQWKQYFEMYPWEDWLGTIGDILDSVNFEGCPDLNSPECPLLLGQRVVAFFFDREVPPSSAIEWGEKLQHCFLETLIKLLMFYLD